MSKVEAYICDFGKHLVEAGESVGIIPSEDLYDREMSYPTIMHPEKCLCHYCLECYRLHVLVPAGQLVDRRGKMRFVIEYDEKIKAYKRAGDEIAAASCEKEKKAAIEEAKKSSEREYELKIKELAFSFRELTVRKWRAGKKVSK